MKLLRCVALAAAVLALPAAALAQTQPTELKGVPWTGLGITLGGGVTDFTSTTLRDETNTGGAWDVRLTLGTQRVVSAEVAYIGSAQNINTLGLDGDAVLLSHGIQGTVRVNMTITTPLQPFIFAGAAWRRYNISSDRNTSDLVDVDNTVEIPVGAGFAVKAWGFLFDARATFNPSFADDLFPGAGNRLHSWNASGSIGYAF